MDKLKLTVKVHWLLLLSGITWTFVGIMLARLAFTWFTVLSFDLFILHSAVGFAFSVFVYRILFYRVASKNIRRINTMEHKASLFQFQETKSYIIIIFMISLGIFLRHTSFIEKKYLGIMYLTIGIAIFLGSFHYYHATWKKKKMSSTLNQITSPSSLA